MAIEVELTDEFESWLLTLSSKERTKILGVVLYLEEKGVDLGYPHSSKIKDSKISQLRELRTQCNGKPYRVLYAFDPRRAAILLIGGCKSGKKNWYEKAIAIAEKLYKRHLEGLNNDEETK